MSQPCVSCFIKLKTQSMNQETKPLTLKQALKEESDGNTNIYNELMYSSYAANRDYGMTHESAVKIGLGNTERLLRYNKENNS